MGNKNSKKTKLSKIITAFVCVILIALPILSLSSCTSGSVKGESETTELIKVDTSVIETEDKEKDDAADTAKAEKTDKKEEKETKLYDKYTVVVQANTGVLGKLCDLFGIALNFFYNLTHNYIIAILILALLFKIILFPLSIKQQKNSQKMAKLMPKQQAIAKKYAGRTDKATEMKKNEEIQKLYSDENYNPASGCLPLFLQFPIIIALYSAINNPLSSVLSYSNEMIERLAGAIANCGQLLELSEKATLTQSTVIAKIANASEGSPLLEGLINNGVNVSQIKEFYGKFDFFGINLMDNPVLALKPVIIIPILVFLASFFSTKIIRKFTYNPNGAQTDASMKIMDWTMPLMILYFSFNVPSLIGIYWIFQNIISIGQQVLLSKMYPVKEPTEAEIHEAELLMKGKKPKNNVVYEDDRGDENKAPKKPVVKKAPIKKKKANSPFIYAKKGIDEKYLERVKAKGKVPKAKMKP